MRTIKTLQIIAVVLFAAAVAVCCLISFGQTAIKAAMGMASEQIEVLSVPLNTLVSGICCTVLGVVYLVMLTGGTTESGSRAGVVVIAVILGVLSVVLLPMANLFFSYSMASAGAWALSAYTGMENLASAITAPLLTSGRILMLLSLGGFYGKGSGG